jgi:hypothetical protein
MDQSMDQIMDKTEPINVNATETQSSQEPSKMTVTKKDKSVIELENPNLDLEKKEVRGTGPVTLKFGDLSSIKQNGNELLPPPKKWFGLFGGKSKSKSKSKANSKKAAKGKKTRRSKK